MEHPTEDNIEIAEGLSWQAGWALSSKNYSFGGYSALLVRDDGRLFAVSDSSRPMDFSPYENLTKPAVFQAMREPEQVEHKAFDLESVVYDPGSGGFWAAFERRNLIIRYDRYGKVIGLRAPMEMQHWWYNSGAEAMTRLETGEFLVVREGARGWFSDVHEALIFDGDPVEEVAVNAVDIPILGGFRPVDANTLPDGRIMLLLREVSFGFPPRFESALMIGSLAQSDDAWFWETDAILPLNGPIPPENYEGLAVVLRDDGAADLWLISDNNMSVLQRTFLIKLRWRPKEKARGAAAR